MEPNEHDLIQALKAAGYMTALECIGKGSTAWRCTLLRGVMRSYYYGKTATEAAKAALTEAGVGLLVERFD